MTMKRSTLLSIAALGVLAAGSALALDAGTPVYIRARNTHGYTRANRQGKVTTLQPSSKAFTWQGNQGTMNKLRAPNGKTVWVYGPNLSLTPPKQELLASSAGSSASMTDMSAADAIKGLGAGAQWYAGDLSPEKGELARRSVATAEAISYQAGLQTRGAK
jgi:hypothetical protein